MGASMLSLKSKVDALVIANEISAADIFDLGEAIIDNPGPDGNVIRIAIIGSLTLDFIAKAVAVGAILNGDYPLIYQGQFGAITQEIAFAGSGLNKFRPDVVIILSDWRDLSIDIKNEWSAEAVEKHLTEKITLLRYLWAKLQKDHKSLILQHLLIPSSIGFGGIADRRSMQSPFAQIREFNRLLLSQPMPGVTFIDVEALAESIGTERFATERLYQTSRLPFDTRYLPEYLSCLAAAWRVCRGKRKKVLVVDLDNTLWGGVIGDDGVSGIKLGPGSPTGESFLDWQRYIIGLRNRGVIIAACSKNELSRAAEGLGHRHSVLTMDKFSALSISWDDKATGLRRIAKDLNVGLDAFVFCDDNPAECLIVSQALPAVTVVHLGSDPSRFTAILERGKWFHSDLYTSEDLRRGSMYEARRHGVEAADSAVDMPTYLSSLRMVGVIKPLDPEDLARAAQLEMKTNQFNLTTKRYSEAALAQFMKRDDVVALTLRLADKFGDHGLVSTMIAVLEGRVLRVESWLMSCRVFSRSCEAFFFSELLHIARERGARTILGEYRPTSKNAVAADVWEKLGFRESHKPGFWLFELDLDGTPGQSQITRAWQ